MFVVAAVGDPGLFSRRKGNGGAVSRSSEPGTSEGKAVDEVSPVGRYLVSAAESSSFEVVGQEWSNTRGLLDPYR